MTWWSPGPARWRRCHGAVEDLDHAVRDCCRFNSAGSLFIDPDSPWQNAWIESFNGRLPDELLSSWRRDYNANSPAHAEAEYYARLEAGKHTGHT